MGNPTNRTFSYKNWDSGFNFYPSDLSKDGNADCEYLSRREPEIGPLSLNVIFGTETVHMTDENGDKTEFAGIEEQLIVYIVYEYTKTLKIDHKRYPTWIE